MTSLLLQLMGLADPLEVGDPIKIKPLDWHTGKSPLGITTRMARLPLDGGWLRIDGPVAVRWQRRLQDEPHCVFVPGPFRGIRAAEQAAQTEYERRILSAVERSLMAYQVPQREVVQKTPPFVSKKLRQFAEGKECLVKSKWCNSDSETVVLCHSRRRAGAGMAQKPHDFWGYHGCSGCHAMEAHIDDGELYDAIRLTQYAVYAAFGTLTP